MATLPDIKPDYTAKKNIEPRVLSNDFGDGYSQRAGDGLNNMPQTWSLSWSGRASSEIDTLEAFFEARGGYEAFTWTPLRGSTALKFICKKWARSYIGPTNDNMSADFEEVFDI